MKKCLLNRSCYYDTAGSEPTASPLVVCDQLLAGVLTEHRYFSGLTASGS
jgi:hypothetical protein